MRSFQPTVVALSLLAPLIAGCLETGEDRVLGIHATGTVLGLVYFDADGSRTLDEFDVRLGGAAVRLVVSGTRDTLARASSSSDGLFRMQSVPVGSYQVAVDSASLGDSAQVVEIDPAEITVTPDDSVTVTIAVSFPIVSVAEARELPRGGKVFVEGIALNDRETFGDASVHLAGEEAAIRVTRVKRSITLPGDSVRFLGTLSTANGQPTLDDATPFLLTLAEVPAAEQVTAGVAATADGGKLDAALVRVDSVTVSDTATVAEDFLLTVIDGSLPPNTLEVLLDGDVGFVLDPFVPDTVLDVTGLLVPVGVDPPRWRLKPRSSADLVVK
jgi:hypothetical protein